MGRFSLMSPVDLHLSGEGKKQPFSFSFEIFMLSTPSSSSVYSSMKSSRYFENFVKTGKKCIGTSKEINVKDRTDLLNLKFVMNFLNCISISVFLSFCLSLYVM